MRVFLAAQRTRNSSWGGATRAQYYGKKHWENTACAEQLEAACRVELTTSLSCTPIHNFPDNLYFNLRSYGTMTLAELRQNAPPSDLYGQPDDDLVLACLQALVDAGYVALEGQGVYSAIR